MDFQTLKKMVVRLLVIFLLLIENAEIVEDFCFERSLRESLRNIQRLMQKSERMIVFARGSVYATERGERIGDVKTEFQTAFVEFTVKRQRSFEIFNGLRIDALALTQEAQR